MKKKHHKSPSSQKKRRMEIIEEIKELKRRIDAIPFLDPLDLRYRRNEKVSKPTTKAVMFCLRDASGSMGKWHREMSIRFLFLLYLFLKEKYESIDIVYIIHTEVAHEVDEEEFFTSQESGGTIVTSALDLMVKIIKDRYPLDVWNIYGCHVSDGDDWKDDLEVAYNTMKNDVIPLVQHYVYVDVQQYQGSSPSGLWQVFEGLAELFENFNMARITDQEDIYPAFRELFIKKEV